jgi:predicted RNA-binding protein YlxR (DUF448 family)
MVGKHVPMRSCAACGQKEPKRQLIRIVRTVEGKVEVDSTGRKPGRGTYLCNRLECWTQGLSKSRLDHVLRSPIAREDKQALLAFYEEHLKAALSGDVR